MSKSVSLYNISTEYLHALDAFTDPENDLPIEAVNDTLEGIEGALQDKAVNVVQYMRNLETTAAAIKEAETGMRQRRQYIEKRAVALKEYVHDSMKETGITKVECPYFKLGVQKNPASVVIETDSAIPAEYKSVVVEFPLSDFERLQDQLPTHTVKETKTSKSDIKTALQADKEVPGALLTQSTRLAIRGG